MRPIITRKRLVAGSLVCVAISLMGTAVVTKGRFETHSWYFTCATCQQNWKRSKVYLWGLPIGMQSGRHVDGGHVPVYSGGLFSRTRWTLLRGEGGVGCGSHNEQSP